MTGEGRVNIVDLLLVRIGALVQRFGITIHRFDVNGDGVVNQADVSLVRQHLGERCDVDLD